MGLDLDKQWRRRTVLCFLVTGSVRAPATGSFICTNTETCSGEISNCRKAMRHHLKKFHKLDKSVIATVWSAASRLSVDFPATHPLREKYNLVVVGMDASPRSTVFPFCGARSVRSAPDCFAPTKGSEGIAARSMKGCQVKRSGNSRSSLPVSFEPSRRRRSFPGCCARRRRTDV